MLLRLCLATVAALCLAGCQQRVSTPRVVGDGTARTTAPVQSASRSTGSAVRQVDVVPVTPPPDTSRDSARSTAKSPAAVDPAVAALIEKLKDKDPRARIKAIEELANKGRDAQPAVPPLLALLRQPDPRQAIHPAVFRAVERLGLDESLLPALLAELKDKDSAVADRAARLLGLMGRPAVEPLLAAFKDEKAPVRLQAAHAFVYMHDPPDKVIPALAALLADKDAGVRIQAASSLGALGPRAVSAVAALIKEVLAGNVMAAKALGDIGPLAAEGVPALRLALADPVIFIPVIWVQPSDAGQVQRVPFYLAEAAAEALGKMGADAGPAAPDLIRVLRDLRPGVRRNAAGALGRIRPEGPKAAAALAATLTDPDASVRVAAAWALGEIGDETSAAGLALVRALRAKGQSEEVVVAAGASLVRRPLQAESAAALLKALKEAPPLGRRYAAKVLGQARPVPEAAVSALVDALSDDQAVVRAAAAEALGNIGPDARPALTPLAKRATSDASEEVKKAATEAISRINK